MHLIGFRAVKSPLYQHRRGNKTDLQAAIHIDLFILFYFFILADVKVKNSRL